MCAGGMYGNSMDRKKLIAEIFIENGKPLCGMGDAARTEDAQSLMDFFNNSGIDVLLVSNLKESDPDYGRSMHLLREICRSAEIPVYVSGAFDTVDNAVNMIHFGCRKVIFDSLYPGYYQTAVDFCHYMGRERTGILIRNEVPQYKHWMQNFSEIFLNGKFTVKSTDLFKMWSSISLAARDDDKLSLTLLSDQDADGKFEETIHMFENVDTFGLPRFSDLDDNVMRTKRYLAQAGIPTGHIRAEMEFAQIKADQAGLVPVIVQDYTNGEVLMLAYMNAASYAATLSTGRMVYYSRSRQELWLKGETSGHFQYVKSLLIDCDADTILAKVSQKGAACHTGNRTCFYRDLADTGFADYNPLKRFKDDYMEILERMEEMKDLL